jgi:hypothetical protein
MGVARVAEAFGHDAEPLGPTDAVLDGHAEAAQASVVVLLLVVQFPPPLGFL